MREQNEWMEAPFICAINFGVDGGRSDWLKGEGELSQTGRDIIL